VRGGARHANNAAGEDNRGIVDANLGARAWYIAAPIGINLETS